MDGVVDKLEIDGNCVLITIRIEAPIKPETFTLDGREMAHGNDWNKYEVDKYALDNLRLFDRYELLGV